MLYSDPKKLLFQEEFSRCFRLTNFAAVRSNKKAFMKSTVTAVAYQRPHTNKRLLLNPYNYTISCTIKGLIAAFLPTGSLGKLSMYQLFLQSRQTPSAFLNVNLSEDNFSPPTHKGEDMLISI